MTDAPHGVGTCAACSSSYRCTGRTNVHKGVIESDRPCPICGVLTLQRYSDDPEHWRVS